MTRRTYGLLFCLLLVLHLTVRTLWFNHGTWGDERFTISAVSGTLREAIDRTVADVHPPLHSVVVWLWRQAGEALGILGDEARAAPYPEPPHTVRLWYRLVNLFFFVPDAVVCVAIARVLLPACRVPALLLLVMLTLGPFGCYWDTTARMYPMMNLGIHLMLLGILRHVAGKRSRCGWLVIGAVAGALACFTQYFAYVYLGLYGLVGFVWRAHKAAAWRAAAVLWGTLAVVLLLSATVLSDIGGQLQWNMGRSRIEHLSGSTFLYGVGRGLYHTAESPSLFLFETDPGGGLNPMTEPLWALPVALVGFAGLGWSLRTILLSPRTDHGRAIGVLLFAAFVPIVVLDLYIGIRDVMPRMVRHYAPSYALYLLVLAIGVDGLTRAAFGYTRFRTHRR